MSGIVTLGYKKLVPYFQEEMSWCEDSDMVGMVSNRKQNVTFLYLNLTL